MKKRSLVSIDDLTTDEIIRILDMSIDFEKEPTQKLLEGKVVSTLFFEPSTRTRLSFESAVSRLGGKIIGFTDASSSSVTKGESLNDTIRTVNNYCDLIVMRHPIEGSARYASEVADVPVINAGDGANQHPTQTMLDLYSIRKTQGTLDNLKIAMVGDLKYGRTVHSLLMAMARWKSTFYFISPDELKMPEEYKQYLDKKGLKYYEHTDFDEVIREADVIYMTRVQRERFSDPMEYEKVKNVYVLRNAMLKGCKENLRILHPLPRVNEINPDVDPNPRAYYFEQALNGVFTRLVRLCRGEPSSGAERRGELATSGSTSGGLTPT
jgi:aspartate carbamoyltransferase catalytic subunit